MDTTFTRMRIRSRRERNKMNSCQKIKWSILIKAGAELPDVINGDIVDGLYEKIIQRKPRKGALILPKIKLVKDIQTCYNLFIK